MTYSLCLKYSHLYCNDKFVYDFSSTITVILLVLVTNSTKIIYAAWSHDFVP